jgi:anti-anti-sigma factor
LREVLGYARRQEAVMDLVVTEMKRAQLVHVSGRVDSSTAPQLQEKLAVLIKGGARNLVINMKDVSFLSSGGLRALLSALQAAKKQGGDVRLSEVSEPVARVLELTSFDMHFKCFGNDTEAVGSF